MVTKLYEGAKEHRAEMENVQCFILDWCLFYVFT